MRRQATSQPSPWIDTTQLGGVNDLLAMPERQVLDFKSARIQPRDLAEILVAFANADGGTIVIGVENDRTILGIRETYSPSSPSPALAQRGHESEGGGTDG